MSSELSHPSVALVRPTCGHGWSNTAWATCQTKAPYGKGEHSFLLLLLVDPLKVADASPWAKRFLTELKQMKKL